VGAIISKAIITSDMTGTITVDSAREGWWAVLDEWEKSSQRIFQSFVCFDEWRETGRAVYLCVHVLRVVYVLCGGSMHVHTSLCAQDVHMKK
jgi:hypothetical protein